MPEDQIPMYNLVVTMTLGYLMSLFSKSGIPVIKCFTPAQIIILMLIIQSFGIISLFWVSMFVGIFVFLILGFRLERTIKNIPKSMVLIIKVSTGMCLIINEIPYAVGITDTQNRHGLTLNSLIAFFMTNTEQNINVHSILTWIIGTITLTYLLIKCPRWPWHLMFAATAITMGYFDTDHEETIADVWGNSESFISNYKHFIVNFMNFYFISPRSDIITDPSFLFYCFVLSIVTLIEIPVTMRMCKEKFRNVPKFKRELVSVGFVNILFGMLGLMPISLPIDRNLLGTRSGGHTKLYIFLGAIFILVFSEFIWISMNRIPYVVISVFNTSLGLLLIDIID